jgi:hypothetical protein
MNFDNSAKMTCAPVLLLIFNRPKLTQQVFDRIREARPEQLYIVADGPRPDHDNDIDLCRKAREIVGKIDWPCSVHRDFADQNLGLKRRVSSGINWVFSQVERAIIIEDDCVPHLDFFTFCDSLLTRYEFDERVWVITGNNFQNGKKYGNAAYYFSKFGHCWGWATWRRAWQHYQGDIPFWPEWKNSSDWRQKTPDKIERFYWSNIFDTVRLNAVDSWAYPWLACIWYHGGLTATPNVNLVTNIGFGPDGTHTVYHEYQDGMPVNPLGPLTHPADVKRDTKADRYVFDHTFGGLAKRPYSRLLRQPKRITRIILRRLRRLVDIRQ